MNNLEKMKSQIIKKIEQMDVKEFEIFTYMLEDMLEESNIKFDKSVLFTCDQCREKYGNCNSDGNEDDYRTEICSERFQKYCMIDCYQGFYED